MSNLAAVHNIGEQNTMLQNTILFDEMMISTLNQYAEIDFYSAVSLKQ